MRDYEMVMVLSPEVSEESLAASIEKMTRSITEKGGTITNVQQWGKRKLSYPIKHFKEGNYVLTQFKLDAKRVAEIEASLRISEEVLRHLVVKVETR